VLEYFKKKKIDDLVVVSTDAGGTKRAKKFADLMGADLAIMHKTRSEHNKAQILEVVGDVAGRTCIIFDDMIDTAGSLISARGALLKRKANTEMYAAATHAVFSGDAVKKLKQARFTEVVVTDSMPITAKGIKGLTVLTIAPMLAQVIRHIERGESVTGIYAR
jgi:ribose-phosphate pyrophosphokinase